MQRMDMTLADSQKLAAAADPTTALANPVSGHMEGISFLSTFPSKGKCTNIVLHEQGIARHLPFLLSRRYAGVPAY